MANILMPFLMSMILGRTIDLRTYYLGGDIFDDTEYDEVKSPMFNSTYQVLQDDKLPYSMMGLPVDLALRIKSGILSSSSGQMGLNGLLRDASLKERSAIIVVGTVVQTVQRSIKKDAKPLPNWTTRISKSQTHYTNSVIYGGWSFIIYRFRCDIPGDAEIVRETLTKSLGVYGNVESKTLKLWEDAIQAIKMNEEIRGRVHVHVRTYSTFPFKKDVSTFGSLLDAVNDSPNLIGPTGKPIYIELLPLHDLDASYPVVKENHTLDRRLEQIDGMYDDVKNTKTSINRWLEETETVLSEGDEIKISDLTAHLSACLKILHQVTSEASVYRIMDQSLLKKALDLYNSKLTNYANSYDRIFRILKEQIDTECQDTFFHKIKGLLHVDDTERIEVGEVEGGLEECKQACLAVPFCRSIGYVDRMFLKVKDASRSIYTLTSKNKLCYVYFRSTSTADIDPPLGASITSVYDRKCL